VNVTPTDIHRWFAKNKAIDGAHLVEDVGSACSEGAMMSDGKIMFRGTPAELTARGERHGVGDAPLDRGYSTVLTQARA
jgi:ABC-2 type transport system ATP-binding protein